MYNTSTHGGWILFVFIQPFLRENHPFPHTEWSRRYHKMVHWSIPLHGKGSDLGCLGCGDCFRGVLMPQIKSIRVLQGLVYWSWFLSESWCQGNVKLELPGVIFLDHRVKINLNRSEWSWDKGVKESPNKTLDFLWMQPCLPRLLKALPSYNVPWNVPFVFKANLSWFLSHETQRLMTSMIPKLNNSFRASKKIKGGGGNLVLNIFTKGLCELPRKGKPGC